VIYSGSTERTSFAEKDEDKGFYHLSFTQNEEQNWRLNEARFIKLPSRPMRDIYIDPELKNHEFDTYLRRVINQIDKKSIIRFRSTLPIRKDIEELMTTKNLHLLLPPEIDFRLGSDFFKK